MNIKVVAPNTFVECFRIPVECYRPGTERVIPIEVFALEAQTNVPMAATVSGWLSVSTNGGSSYSPLPTSVQSGVEVGPFFAGERKTLLIKVALPGGAELRNRRVGLVFGGGT